MPKTACTSTTPLAQSTLLALLTEDNSVYQMLAPLPRSAWKITSFDARASIACVAVYTGSLVTILSVSIPPVTVKFPS